MKAAFVLLLFVAIIVMTTAKYYHFRINKDGTRTPIEGHGHGSDNQQSGSGKDSPHGGSLFDQAANFADGILG
ncbi:hypothetical protein TNCV_4576951 [Trichonephila clavipes]|nr:hypothetical protein TNCV_4576951 [Trichonephila clavipes]